MEPRPKPGYRKVMERFRLVSLVLVLAVLCSAPAAALHTRYLYIGVGRNGDATVTFEYTLPWIEQALAFIGLVNPDRDLGQILAASAKGPVDQLSASAGTASFSVRGFANVTVNPRSTTYDTSPVNLTWGQIGYESSILAPLLEPDFSPDLTVIRFPDAYSLTFRDLLIIPNTTHTF